MMHLRYSAFKHALHHPESIWTIRGSANFMRSDTRNDVAIHRGQSLVVEERSGVGLTLTLRSVDSMDAWYETNG